MTELVLGTCRKTEDPHYKQHDCEDWMPNEEPKSNHADYTLGNPGPMGVCTGAPYAQHPKKSTCVNWRPINSEASEPTPLDKAAQFLADRSLVPIHRNGNRWGWDRPGTYPDVYFPTFTDSVYGVLDKIYEATRAEQQSLRDKANICQAEADAILALLKQERKE